jgi:thiamine-phosphate pyrophosphorylase
MEMNKVPERVIKSGIYLVVDPAMEEAILLKKIAVCLREKLAAVQIWDNFQAAQDIPGLVQKIGDLCHEKDIPVLLNNRWEILNDTVADGVHFDQIPENISEIRASVNKPFLSGLTCNNDLAYVRWATANKMDYISFCSMFPSTTSNSCDLVDFRTVQSATEISNLPIFLAGGIRPENVANLQDLRYFGIAVISGIMSSDKPDESIREYYKRLNMNRYEN